tara:strand:+ start:4913 stop:5218 length:306 start_codon:yes stop_codon:yes gene_type:complete
MDQRFTTANLINELGHTQIQAMLWRLDHLQTAQTNVSLEFDFVTGQTFPTASIDERILFLKQIQSAYAEQLGRTWKTQASARKSLHQPAPATEGQTHAAAH